MQYLILAGFLFFQLQTNGQCPVGDLYFSSQEMIDEFPATYPGCHAIQGNVQITGSDIVNLDSLYIIDTVSGYLYVWSNYALTDISGLNQLKSVGGSFVIRVNNELTAVPAFENLRHVGDVLNFYFNEKLAHIAGFNQLEHTDSVCITGNSQLIGISGFNKINGTSLKVKDNPALESITGLDHFTQAGDISINSNIQLAGLSGLNQLNQITGNLEIEGSANLAMLPELTHLQSIGGTFRVSDNAILTGVSGFPHLQSIGGGLTITGNSNIQEVAGFDSLFTVDQLFIYSNNALVSLTGFKRMTAIQSIYISDCLGMSNISGFDSLKTISSISLLDISAPEIHAFYQLQQINGTFGLHLCSQLKHLNNFGNVKSVGALEIVGNPVLEDISGLVNINTLTSLEIRVNTSLAACAIAPICALINGNQGFVWIEDNAPGCNSTEEILLNCTGIPFTVQVFLDGNGDCIQDALPVPASHVLVGMIHNQQMNLRSVNPLGNTFFMLPDSGVSTFLLPEFPSAHWEVCVDSILINPDTLTSTSNAVFLLQPLDLCPDLHTELQLPSFFRNCEINSTITVINQNVGSDIAQNTKVAVIIPQVLEVVSTSLNIANIVGDTLYFETGDLLPFELSQVQILVHTRCDTFLLGRTLCLEAMGFLDNPCPPVQETSDVRVHTECLSDTTVRFHLKNILGGATQNPHEYIIIEDEIVLMNNPFNLGPYGSMTVDVPANGATYRMEATQLEDGTLIATANEGCGGFTPGVVTAFWLNSHLSDYDYDCREVVLAYDPNQKTAIPKGVGDQHLLPANQPITYTIDFQNTGTDTAFRVLLRDILSPNLDVTTFRPGAASHPYTWEILNNDSLLVLFQPIMLPDSNVNEEASHGWFSFTINQRPDLPDGTVIKNKASIIFDYNPPIITNTTFHTIGELTVSFVETPQQQYAGLWRLLGNPAVTSATLVAANAIPGDKQFRLVNAAGKVMRTQTFAGQRLEIERRDLASGVYYFTIIDQLGRVFGGKLMVK